MCRGQVDTEAHKQLKRAHNIKALPEIVLFRNGQRKMLYEVRSDVAIDDLENSIDGEKQKNRLHVNSHVIIFSPPIVSSFPNRLLYEWLY